MQSISLKQETHTSLQQHQQLLMNLAMKQAFHVLQLPLLELSEWLNEEIQTNPVLELQPPTKFYFKRHSHNSDLERQKNAIPSTVSLYEHLIHQASLTFTQPEDLKIAEWLIGHFNEKGFLESPLNQIAPHIPLPQLQHILQTIQTFDPPGIGAQNLQESLILQLQVKDPPNPIALQILQLHFADLLHNRLPLISKQLHLALPQLIHVIKTHIAPLDLNPGYKYHSQIYPSITPDLYFHSLEGKWQVEVNLSFIPQFHIAPLYLQALKDQTLENEEYFYLRRQLTQGRWIMRTLNRRNQTLSRIGRFVLKKQQSFFNAEKAGLIPLSFKEAAQALDLHESTIARAVANKYVSSPLGIFPLKSFFQQGPVQAKISNHSLRAILAKTIQQEDKASPLSDAQLAKHFKKLGFPCARRTITKYRSSLKIASSCRRKKWSYTEKDSRIGSRTDS